jgi:cytochrome c oxidase cbb3-type subunit 2
LNNPRDVVPESNMPGFTWLEGATLDGQEIVAKMRALRKIGVPYAEQEIATAAEEVRGHSEMDALIDYLQMLKFHGEVTP